jgi:hypothetical protein
MQDERAGFESDEQVFRAPIDGNDTLAADGGFEFRSDGPAQATIADDHVDEMMPNERGCDAPPRGFYFGKLGQLRLKLFDLRFFVSDVLAHHGIEFLRLEFVRVQALIFGGRVVVTGAGGGNQFDFVAHEQPLKP